MDVCTEKHRRVDERLDTQERRLNNQGERIDRLEQFKSSTETEIKNLVEQIRALVSTIKWFIGLSFSTLAGFFIWYIQNL